MNMWKRLVKQILVAHAEREWNIKAPLFPSMEILAETMPALEVNAWWAVAQQNPCYLNSCRIIMRLLLDVHSLQNCKSRYDDDVSALCPHCEEYVCETVEHWMFECSKWGDVRHESWKDVMDNCPTDVLKTHISGLLPRQRAKFLISCMYNSYIVEWNALYTSILNFVTKMHKIRDMEA